MPRVKITKPWWENIYHLRSPDFKDSDLDGGIQKEMFVLLKENRVIVLEVAAKIWLDQARKMSYFSYNNGEQR